MADDYDMELSSEIDLMLKTEFPELHDGGDLLLLADAAIGEALLPVTTEIPISVVFIKNQLSAFTVKLLSNEELAIIHDNILCFTHEELLRLPNVQVMDKKSPHYPKKEALEIMMVVQNISATYGLPLHDVLLPLLKNRHSCHCGRERKHGCFCCSLHNN